MNAIIRVSAVAGLAGLMLAVFVLAGRARLSEGRLYPADSSFLAGRDGTRLLADTLVRLPGYRVERNLAPLAALPAAPARLILFAGLSPAAWRAWDADEVAAIDRAVRAGSSVVLPFQGRVAGATAKDEPACAAARAWQVDLVPGKDAGTPLAFSAVNDADWRHVPGLSGEPPHVERHLGRGCLILYPTGGWLRNEALGDGGSGAALARLIGTTRAATFDETHLGVRQDTGIAALGRRYGLTGAAALFGAAALLFVWARLAAFLPQREEEPALLLNYAPAAGLEALLRRSVPESELIDRCVKEAAAAEMTGAAAVSSPIPPAGGGPCAAYNARVRPHRRFFS